MIVAIASLLHAPPSPFPAPHPTLLQQQQQQQQPLHAGMIFQMMFYVV
jgi:hypothetical protein